MSDGLLRSHITRILLYRDPHLHTHCRDCSTVPATATTWIVWSCRLKWCFASASAGKGANKKNLRVLLKCLAMPCWWGPTKPKQLSMAATARVIWLCACVKYWPYRRVVSCDPLRNFYLCCYIVFTPLQSTGYAPYHRSAGQIDHTLTGSQSTGYIINRTEAFEQHVITPFSQSGGQVTALAR